ncbi:hypothetical protein R3W88_032308 [Solanum pinnatisectum]|uniref:Uncharacterized protein n=1 Tax=Solanum pinnatisectum TaxID=50273 RepID=A0AAV9LNT7_9SOLN|nr:hypothetical protein R3W88_032308 [Solanum pinnatisectum]
MWKMYSVVCRGPMICDSLTTIEVVDCPELEISFWKSLSITGMNTRLCPFLQEIIFFLKKLVTILCLMINKVFLQFYDMMKQFFKGHLYSVNIYNATIQVDDDEENYNDFSDDDVDDDDEDEDVFEYLKTITYHVPTMDISGDDDVIKWLMRNKTCPFCRAQLLPTHEKTSSP